jgi:hypothetical protein
MSSSSVFDSLVATLSSDERRNMLERIRASVAFDEEPVERPLEPHESDAEQAYLTMGLAQKLLVLLRMVFGGLSREEAVERTLFGRLERRLRTEAGHLVDVTGGVFLPEFKEELARLKEAAEFFAAPLGRIRRVGTDAFYSFVLGLETPDTQDDLLSDTDPFVLSRRKEDADEYELRREAEGRLADLLANLPPWVRSRMAANARFFESLSGLSGFGFAELLGSFEELPGEGERCDTELLRQPLQQLGRLLEGLSVAPSPAFIEGLVLFNAHVKGEPEDLESYVNERVDVIHSRLEVIRGFGRRVGFFDILRYVAGDLSFHLPKPPSGEHWKGQVERFWSRRVEELFQLYSFERKKEHLLSDAQELTDDEAVAPIEGYPAHEGRRTGTHATSLGVLGALLRRAADAKATRTLKTLFVQGSFYKDENRAEFNEYYNELGDLRNAVQGFEDRLAPGGDLHASLQQARRFAAGAEDAVTTDGTPDVVSVIERIDEDADRLVRRGVETFHGLSEIIHGVLYSEVSGRYDTLSNLDEVGGRDNKAFKEDLDEVLQFAKAAASVLSSMYDVERTSARRRAALDRRSG